MMDHARAWSTLGRISVGVPVPRPEEREALAHAAGCDWCALGLGSRAGGKAEVEPDALFDRALTSALRGHPDAVARERAAEQLGARDGVSTSALLALAEAAERDPEARVRDAAERALEALGVPPGPGRPGPAPA